MSSCNSPNLVKCHDVYASMDLKIIVMEYCNGGDLDTFLHGAAVGAVNETALEPQQAVEFASDLARGLAAIHKARLVHRDVKPENVVITADARAVLIDFGAARADATRHTRAVSSLLVVFRCNY